MEQHMILTPFLDDADVILYAGDCIEVMARMPGSSVDAIVTDPPYGLEFMGKGWDGFGTPLGFQTWTEAWAVEAFRVLKPGGHLLAFAGTRTYHRMASGVEDAGFEIRDCIAWMYGSGFPKSLDVSKAIDKAAGAEREVVGTRTTGIGTGYGNTAFIGDSENKNLTAPATPEAKAWNGWGTALKPAFEPVVVARRPLIGTVAANVLENGTGALNIDACRIGTNGETIATPQSDPHKRGATAGEYAISTRDTERMHAAQQASIERTNTLGRWPANIALDATAAKMLDEQSGELPGASSFSRPSIYKATSYTAGNAKLQLGYGDNGGASRFFYTAKASRQDRNVGGLADNTHPTVKPTDLMRWLIRLVTPPGGIILDPFGGSGSTGLAARAENVRCILIEREPEYLQIIRDRLAQQNLFAERVE